MGNFSRFEASFVAKSVLLCLQHHINDSTAVADLNEDGGAAAPPPFAHIFFQKAAFFRTYFVVRISIK